MAFARQIQGASDAPAAYPKSQPVSPENIHATMYHALGLSPETEIQDPEGGLAGSRRGGRSGGCFEKLTLAFRIAPSCIWGYMKGRLPVVWLHPRSKSA